MTEFSVAMSVYEKDNPEWFKCAVDSILNQTVKPSEIVLVVDGSVSDEMNFVISQYELLPIFKIIRLENNRGLGVALAIGVDNCKYDLIARMDADDISAPNRFEKQIAMFENDPQLSLVGSNISEFIDVPSNIVGVRNVPNTHDEICEYIRKRCPFNHMTVMFRKKAIQDAGGYCDWHYNEDYFLWIRMYLCNKRFANISDILVNVRIGRDMYKRRGGWKYFRSEAKLQKYMLANHVIDMRLYCDNILKRFMVQVLLPTSLRGAVYKKFARKPIK